MCRSLLTHLASFPHYSSHFTPHSLSPLLTLSSLYSLSLFLFPPLSLCSLLLSHFSLDLSVFHLFSPRSLLVLSSFSPCSLLALSVFSPHSLINMITLSSLSSLSPFSLPLCSLRSLLIRSLLYPFLISPCQKTLQNSCTI